MGLTKVVMVVGQVLKEKKEKGKSPEKILAEAVIEGTKMTTTENGRRNQWGDRHGGCSFHPRSPKIIRGKLEGGEMKLKESLHPRPGNL